MARAERGANCAARRLIGDQAVDWNGQQLLASTQESKLDNERTAYDLSTKLTDELASRVRGATGSQQVIDNQHALSFSNRVDVQLKSVGPVFQ